MSYKCTKERFLEDVKHHEIEIISESGTNRHIRFKNPSTRNMYFDLTTWGDHLCFSGDMGTYVFQRVEDMFTFFRRDDIPDGANYYWDEKLESVCKRGGRKEWREELFVECVMDYIDMWFEDEPVDVEKIKEFVNYELEYKDLCCHQLCWQVLDDLEYEIRTYQDGCDEFAFDDFWEGTSCDEFTYHYMWCQMAIAWGVQKYDMFKKNEQEERLKK